MIRPGNFFNTYNLFVHLSCFILYKWLTLYYETIYIYSFCCSFGRALGLIGDDNAEVRQGSELEVNSRRNPGTLVSFLSSASGKRAPLPVRATHLDPAHGAALLVFFL